MESSIAALACPLVNFTVQSTAMLSPFLLAACFSVVSSVTVTDIQGPAFRSPLEGQTVNNLTGIVTAKVGHYRMHTMILLTDRRDLTGFTFSARKAATSGYQMA